jgi:hypothetical protein
MPNHPEPRNTDLRGMGNDPEDKDGLEILIRCADSLPVSSQVLRAATAVTATVPQVHTSVQIMELSDLRA